MCLWNELVGGGALPFRPRQVCATKQCMVFKVFSLKQGIQCHF